MKEEKIYKVVDLFYTEEEGNTVFRGTLEKCEKFIEEQLKCSPINTFKIIPIIK